MLCKECQQKVIVTTKSGHPIYEKHVKQALKNHNSGQEIKFSDQIEMNKQARGDENSEGAHALRAKGLVSAVHNSKHGILGDKRGKVSMKDLKEHGPMLGHSIDKSMRWEGKIDAL